jgi:hypothetical protein
MHVGTGFKGAGEFVNKKYACVLYKEN